LRRRKLDECGGSGFRGQHDRDNRCLGSDCQGHYFTYGVALPTSVNG